LQVAKVENWRLESDEGGKLEVNLADELEPAVGDTLQPNRVLRDRSSRSRWTEVASF
jgi:hypothetical protein